MGGHLSNVHIARLVCGRVLLVALLGVLIGLYKLSIVSLQLLVAPLQAPAAVSNAVHCVWRHCFRVLSSRRRAAPCSSKMQSSGSHDGAQILLDSLPHTGQAYTAARVALEAALQSMTCSLIIECSRCAPMRLLHNQRMLTSRSCRTPLQVHMHVHGLLVVS